MTEDLILEVRGVSKKYSIGLRQSLRYGVEDLMSEATARRSPQQAALRPGEFWALQDVSFEIHRGQSFGVLGVNGAGKSTLLRLAAGLTKPDAGELVVRGRVGVLLDPTGGFNPVLTGRENLRASSQLWGLSSSEVDDRSAEILAFADLGDFIDAPVRTYSKGMRMRLAFAVSAHLDPDLLLIDEALAVGDVNFQRKCAQYLRRFVGEGGSLLLVSHSVWAVQAMCDNAMQLHDGQLVTVGNAANVARSYTEFVARLEVEASATVDSTDRDGSDAASATGTVELVGTVVSFSEVVVQSEGGGPAVVGRPAEIVIRYVSKEQVAASMWVILVLSGDGLVCIAGDGTIGATSHVAIERGSGTVHVAFPAMPLTAGSYMLRVAVIDVATNLELGPAVSDAPATFFTVEADDSEPSLIDAVAGPPLVTMPVASWDVEPIS